MMPSTKRARAMLSVALVAACGSDDDKPRGTLNTASVDASLDEIQQLSAAIGTSDGFAAAGAALAIATAGQSMVLPASASASAASPYGRATETATSSLPARIVRPVITAIEGSMECTGATCTYDNYGDDWLRINGSISVLPERVMFDLMFDVKTGETSTFHWDLDGDLAANARSIDGWVDCSGTGSRARRAV